MDNSRDEDDKIRQQSLSKRMDETMVEFLSQVFLACIDHMSSTSSAELRDRDEIFCSYDVQERVENLFHTLRCQSKRIVSTASPRSKILTN